MSNGSRCLTFRTFFYSKFMTQFAKIIIKISFCNKLNKIISYFLFRPPNTLNNRRWFESTYLTMPSTQLWTLNEAERDKFFWDQDRRLLWSFLPSWWNMVRLLILEKDLLNAPSWKIMTFLKYWFQNAEKMIRGPIFERPLTSSFHAYQVTSVSSRWLMTTEVQRLLSTWTDV